MAVFQRVGVTSGGSLDHAATYVSLQAGSDGEVALHDFGFGVSSWWSVEGAIASRVAANGAHEGAGRMALTVGGQSGSVLRDAVSGAFAAWDAGERSGQTLFLGTTAFAGNAVSVLAAEVDGQQMVFAALQNGTGLIGYRYNNGALSGGVTYGAANSPYSEGISDIVIVQAGGSGYLFTASAAADGLTGYRVSATGALTQLMSLGAQDSLPVATLTALDAAQVGGAHFLIAAASGTSSLTVFSISAQGQTTVTDHIIDSLDTRFQGVTQLEVVQMGAHSFVLAAGMDDGLSLFRLTAEGRLIHAHTIEDSTITGIAGISAMVAVEDASGFDVVVTSANEAGMTRFRVDLEPTGIIATVSGDAAQGTSGADILTLGAGGVRAQSGAGDDIVIDGSGEDRMQGGAGADTFVLLSDGLRDRIDDFDVREDRLDLSRWTGLYSASQLQVQNTNNGVRIRFGTEEIDLRTYNGAPLTAVQIAAVTAVSTSHVDVVLGPRLVSAGGPAPAPAPQFAPVTPAAPQVAGQSFTPDPPPAPGPEPDPFPAPPSWQPSSPDPEPAQPVTPPPQSGLSLAGGNGNDLLSGGSEDDRISGGGGNDTLEGGGGNDLLAGSSGNDRISGGGGNDNMGGGLCNDTIRGGAGDDTAGGGQGNDVMFGDDGNDVFSGGPGDDLLEGGNGDDMLAGSFGNDTVNGGNGNDNMGGGTGKDIILGGAGNDTIGGGEGDDRIDGGDGNDFIAGGGRNDTLFGEAGSDTLNGGTGDDTITGGSGADIFVFNDLNQGEYDTITDFQTGVDTLRLHGVSGSNQSARYANLDIDAVSGGTEISYDGHVIFLEGVAAGALDRFDFLFV